MNSAIRSSGSSQPTETRKNPSLIPSARRPSGVSALWDEVGGWLSVVPISPSVGALSGYLSRIISSTVYNRAKTDVEEIVRKIPRLGSRLHKVGKRLEETVKSLIVPGAFFEHLGFRYIGPVDGHNVDLLINTLENIRHLRGPILFHIVTTKGKGYEPAERDPAFYHGAKPFDVATGKINGENHVRRPGQPEQTYTKAFAEALIDLARDDDRIVALTAAMAPGTGLTKFSEVFPDRFHDVGIAEQHATSFAAGMAIQHPMLTGIMMNGSLSSRRRPSSSSLPAGGVPSR